MVAKNVFAGRGLVFNRGLEMFQKTGLDKRELKWRGGDCDPQLTEIHAERLFHPQQNYQRVQLQSCISLQK